MKVSIVSFNKFICIFLGLLASTKIVAAQSIQTDGTTATEPINCSGDCTISGGLQQGENLFHSFERFNVDQAGIVLFQDPGVTNILSRVTGNELSEILGTLGVSGGTANLFLINPNGIIFGQDSSLDLNGSFLATTADSIRFSEQGLLDTVPNDIPLLTINPSALSFSDSNQGEIRNESIAPAGADLSGIEETALGLRVPDGKSLVLVGGDVIFDGGRVNAFGGRVELGGLVNEGDVELNFSNIDIHSLSLSYSDNIPRANVVLTNQAVVNVPARGGGDIAIIAKDINILEESFLRAGIGFGLGADNNRAGNIILDATKKINIENNSGILNDIAPDAQDIIGGDININSDSLLINNNSFIQTAIFGEGSIGNIRINVPNGMVEIRNNSAINSIVESLGDSSLVNESGDIQIIAQGVSLEEMSFIDASNGFGQGNAGDIDVKAETINIDSGSQLTASVFDQGQGGNIFLDISDSVTIVGFDTEGFSSGIVTSTEPEATGQAGNITVNTDRFQIAEGGIISSQTFNESDGGNISISSNTYESIEGGQILTSATSSGNAGNISIQVTNNLSLSGSDSSFESRIAEFGDVGNEAPGNSGFFANVRSEASGTGGNINVKAGQLSIFDNAEINVSANGSGAAGSLTIDAQDIALDRGSLTAETMVGDQGNITLNNADTLLLRNNSEISTDATELATGGNITLSSEGIALLDNSDINARAVEGRGGNIQITTQGIFQEPDSEITAASDLGIDGTVTFNTPDVDPASGIFELPDIPIDAAGILAQDLCKFENDKIAKGSSFIITGRGGLTSTSESSLENRDRIVNWTNRKDLEVSNNATVGIRQREEQDIANKTYPEIKQSQGLFIAADGSTWLTANAPNTVPQGAKKIHPDCQTQKSATRN